MPNPTPLNPPVLDHSRPVIRQPVELATHLGLKLYNRTFPRLEAALYLAEVIVHLQGRASRDYAEEIDQVNAAIAQELERLTTFATGEARHAGKLAKSGVNGASREAMEINYTQPIRVNMTMRTPRARRYATLLADLEKTGRTLDLAWYTGTLDTAQRLNLENLLFRNCMRSCGVIERLARGLARRVRDDTAAPGYRDMLMKRTGRAPDAASAPAVAAEGRADMTAEEAASLQATEALASTLLAAPEDAPQPEAPGPTEGGIEAETARVESAEDLGAAEARVVTALLESAPEDTKLAPRPRRIRDLVQSGGTGG